MCAETVSAHTPAELETQLGGSPTFSAFRRFQKCHVVAPRLHSLARRVTERVQGGSTWQKKIVVLLLWIE